MQTTLHYLPDHASIDPSQIGGELDELITSYETEIATIVDNSPDRELSWDSVMMPLESLKVALDDFWAPISHLNSVKSNDALREAHDDGLQKITALQTRLQQSEPLYTVVKTLQESGAYTHFEPIQKKIINDVVRDFERQGISLPPNEKRRVEELRQKLAELSSQFQNNLLDSTDAWEEHILDESLLEGIAEATKDVAKQVAQSKGLEGFVLTLDMACFASVMRQCDNRDLRQRMYLSNVTRASELAQAGDIEKFDNAQIVDEIMRNRTELAKLLEFSNFAEYSMDLKMAKSATEVHEFLSSLLEKVLPQAKTELAELREFARDELGYENLEPWDLNYATEKLRESQYEVKDSVLRTYFPFDVVVDGMLRVAESLFNIDIAQADSPASWHDEVRFYEIQRDREVIARFYLDAFARTKKRGGAWMAECRSRRLVNNEVELPVAYLTCNFTPPTENSPSLLAHSEVVTLFHEFGHGLHHMLTQQKYATVSGINGVEWDAVELPSQFMENWCWQKNKLKQCSQHIDTEDSIPNELLEKLVDSKNLNSALTMVRQLEFGLLDIELHMQTKEFDPIGLMHQIRDRTGMLPMKDYDRFPNSFAHIFAGGYAAGYYSYLWAEVLSADAFAAFEEEGLDNASTGQRFLTEVLEKGSSITADEMYRNFRGRDATPDALLRHSGIVA